MRKNIFGMGTGRCGTHSLAKLIDLQFDTICLHEPLRHEVEWDYKEEHALAIINHVKRLGEDSDNVGSVALNYLPYVERLNQEFPDARFVILKRNKRDTVKSYLKWIGEDKGFKNHWMEHDGTYWNHDDWDNCYPKFHTDDINQAVQMYWDLYYKRAAELEAQMPNLKVFWMSDLNDNKTVAKILDFCGFEQKNIIAKVKESVQKYEQ